MNILVRFDDDEIRQYSGENKKDCIALAKKRAQQMETNICSIIDCERDGEDN